VKTSGGGVEVEEEILNLGTLTSRGRVYSRSHKHTHEQNLDIIIDLLFMRKDCNNFQKIYQIYYFCAKIAIIGRKLYKNLSINFHKKKF
jgi:hypothetical protein